MIFENLSDKLQNAFKGLKSRGKLSEKDIDLAMREVKLALLEADVNFKVVKDFIKQIKERSMGAEVTESLTPGQQVIKIVNEELTALMGGVESKITHQLQLFWLVQHYGKNPIIQRTGNSSWQVLPVLGICGKNHIRTIF